jgi:hypothetical protein
MMLVSQLSISGIIYQSVLHIQELNRNLRVDEKYMDGGLYVHVLAILRSTSLVTVVFYFLCLYRHFENSVSRILQICTADPSTSLHAFTIYKIM